MSKTRLNILHAKLRLPLLLFAAVTVFTEQPSLAEDSDSVRPYLRFHSGDIDPLWGVDDMWSFGVGANLNKRWGAEMGIEFYERDFEQGGDLLGEIGAMNLIPQLRWRQPLNRGRIVPYVVGGAGATILQYNDRMPAAFGRQVAAEGASFSAVLGAGVEFYLADNVSFDVMARYFWIQPIRGSVDNQPVDVALSAPTFTFGLRVYFNENKPRPLITREEKSPTHAYFGARIGYSLFTDSDWFSGVDFRTEQQGLRDTLNLGGGLVVGVDFGEHWGVELSAESLEYRIDTDAFGIIGEYGMGLIAANARYRRPSANGRWVPYAMAGLGVAYGEINDPSQGSAGLDVDAKGLYPLVNVGVGIDYFVVRNVTLFADANWYYSWNHKMDIAGTPVGGSGDFSTLMFHIGFRVYLWE